jgi:hypothetical protein
LDDWPMLRLSFFHNPAGQHRKALENEKTVIGGS